MCGFRGGGGPDPPPLEFAKLNIADITGNEKISYFSYLCIGPPPEKFSGSAPVFSSYQLLLLSILMYKNLEFFGENI